MKYIECLEDKLPEVIREIYKTKGCPFFVLYECPSEADEIGIWHTSAHWRTLALSGQSNWPYSFRVRFAQMSSQIGWR